ncbi:MAG TPA: peptidoglycan bridge formation glycyltransferase FemA/FemB family protein [Patescibacteria group bacterium]
MQNKTPYPKSFLQSDIWGSFRETQGWHAHKLEDVLILERPLPLGKSFLYAPEVFHHPSLLITLLPAIYEVAQRRNSLFFRLELNIPKTDPLAQQWRAAFTYTGFQKAFESVQPDDRQIVTLSGGEHATLKQMKQKGRYNIRVAERAGVTVRETTLKTLEEDVAIFYALFEETAKRDKFSIRSQAYFQELAQVLYHHNCGKVFIASLQGIPLAASITTLYDGVASYLYGASSSEHRAAMAPYLLHWTVMQWAMSKNATSYDLLAIKPDTDKKHAYDGITRFKQQFGGESIHLMGSWDVPLQALWYTLFKAAESIRRH